MLNINQTIHLIFDMDSILFYMILVILASYCGVSCCISSGFKKYVFGGSFDLQVEVTVIVIDILSIYVNSRNFVVYNINPFH